MKKHKIKYTDEPIGEIEEVPDFLPEPESLVLKEDTAKVTLTLTKKSIQFFKEQASEHHTQYQKMIRVLLDQYATHFYAKKRAVKQKGKKRA